MDSGILDTDVVSYLLKNDSRYEKYRTHVEGRLIAISFMSVAELERGAVQNGWSKDRREQMMALLQSFIQLYPNRETCEIWAEIMVKASRSGYTIHGADAWVAAAAIQHRCPLISNNRKHFFRIDGLHLISEPSES